MSTFTVQLGKKSFQLNAPDATEGPVVSYGQVSAVVWKDEVYFLRLDHKPADDDDDDIIIECVKKTIGSTDCEIEDVLYEDEEPDEADEEEGEANEEEEEEEDEVEAGPKLV